MKYIVPLLAVAALGGCGLREYHDKANVLYATVEVEGVESLPDMYREPVRQWYEARKATPFPRVAKVRRLVEALKSAEDNSSRLQIIRDALATLKD